MCTEGLTVEFSHEYRRRIVNTNLIIIIIERKNIRVQSKNDKYF